MRHWLLAIAVSSFTLAALPVTAATKNPSAHHAVKKKHPAAKHAKKPKPTHAPPVETSKAPRLPAVTVSAPRYSTDLDAFLNEPGDYRFAIQYGGLTRTYRVHVPERYDPAEPTPLVVALHGNGRKMEDAASDTNYGLVDKSEREGFIAVFPDAANTPGQGRAGAWNRAHVDDVGFVRQVVTNVFRQTSISRNRIYAAGIGSGGALAYRLACELPGIFRAVATVSPSSDAGGCTPAKPVSVLHIQARNDTGTRAMGAGANRPGNVVQAASLPGGDTASRWAQADGCYAKPRHVLDTDGAMCQQWSWCRAQSEVQLCVTDSGGRSWPGASKAPPGETPSTAISATDTLWAFFSRH
jgi:polyhydroxybutyrate depolymerase